MDIYIFHRVGRVYYMGGHVFTHLTFIKYVEQTRVVFFLAIFRSIIEK